MMHPTSQLADIKKQIHHFYSRQGYDDHRNQKPFKLTEVKEVSFIRLLRSHGLWRQKTKYIQARANDQRHSKGMVGGGGGDIGP